MLHIRVFWIILNGVWDYVIRTVMKIDYFFFIIFFGRWDFIMVVKTSFGCE